MAATPTSGVIAKLEALQLNNYEDWSFRVKTYLLAEDLWDFVEASNEAPKQEDGHEAEFKAWRKNNAKALYAIQTSCGDSTYPLIRGITTAKDAWRTLAEKLNKPVHETDKRSILEMYPPRVQCDAEEEQQSAAEEGKVGVTSDEESTTIDDLPADIKTHSTAFVYYLLNDDWNEAMLLRQGCPNLIIQTLPDGNTPLQLVVENLEWPSKKRVDVAKKLVELTTPEDLEAEMANEQWKTMFSILTFLPEAIDLVECIYNKNNHLLASTASMPPDLIPLMMAQSLEFGEKMALYLYKITPHQTIGVTTAAQLNTVGFKLKRFDVAWDLIQRHPILAITKDYKGKTPLTVLAGMHSAFLSGSRPKSWEKLVYYGIHIKPAPTIDGTFIDVQNSGLDGSNQRHHPICSAIWICNGVMHSFYRPIVTNLHKILGLFNGIYKLKLVHVRILECLHMMCKVLEDTSVEEMKYIGFGAALFLATERGHVEYIDHLCRANRGFLPITSKKNQSLFQFAIECRQKKVYDLIYRFSERYQTTKLVIGHVDEFGDTVLHMAGRFSPLANIKCIRGAALQMQRELHWFKEVESVAGSTALDTGNDDDLKRRELFTKNHTELVKEGEKSMKETATSCTVVSALIVTIIFAAAFTVPGGNYQDTGIPIFLEEKVLKLFFISLAITLFSSTTSVIIFLGILTSRYAEDDFRKSLPTKMILGLLTLFFFHLYHDDCIFLRLVHFASCKLNHYYSSCSVF